MLLGTLGGSCARQLRAPTCVVMSQPSSRLTSTEEPVSSSSTTSTEICRILWICQGKDRHLTGSRKLICCCGAKQALLLEHSSNGAEHKGSAGPRHESCTQALRA